MADGRPPGDQAVLPGRNIEASCWSRVMCVSVRLGRTGPANCRIVGSRCPNRSTSPGPEKLSEGAAAPTPISSPATVTSCIGVTTRASAIAAAATRMPAPR